MNDIIKMAQKLKISHSKLADYLGYTAGYWYDIRSGRAPLTKDVLDAIKDLKKKFKAFEAA